MSYIISKPKQTYNGWVSTVYDSERKYTDGTRVVISSLCYVTKKDLLEALKEYKYKGVK